MRLYTHKEALAGGGLVVLAIIIGAAGNALGWALFGAALLGLAHQHRALAKFARWARQPLRRPHLGNGGLQQAADSLRWSLLRSRRRVGNALRYLARIRGVTEALPDAAVLIDGDGDIEAFNQASGSLLHLSRQDVGGNLGALLRHPEVVSLLKQRVPDATIEIGSPFAEGQRLELRRVNVAADRDLILARDVTHLNRLLSMRQDFVANVSHELRTPLTVVVGYLEAIEEESMDEATLRHLVGKLVSPTRRMQALVDDLLMLTRLESSPNPKPEDLALIDVKELVDRVVDEVAGLTTKQHRIERRMRSDLRVLGIEKELHSACSNLITNAVKYSPQGGSIDITWSSNGDGALFEVRDQGMGIPPEHLSRLTERFYRVDLAGSRVRGGTGLGLAIVKHVLKRHNTQLQVESEVGEGSRFYCRFNSDQLQPHSPATIEVEGSAPILRQDATAS